MSGPGTFFGIEIARRGIMAQQKSLEVTGHNIANANTKGYSRQEAVHKSGIAYPVPGLNSGTNPGQVGSGVEIDEIRRIRNDYLDAQFRNSTASKSFWESKLDILEQIETIIPEPDSRGIQDVLIDFFSDWHDLNDTPQDDGIKSAVVVSGRELARLFRDTYDQLANVEKSIFTTDGSNKITGGKIGLTVDRINELTKRIQDVTDSIVYVKKSGQQPNDLLDERDALLDELAEYLPINVESAGENGEITLTTAFSTSGDQLNLLDANGLTAEYNSGTNKIELKDTNYTIELSDLNLIDAGSGSLLGSVAAWMELKGDSANSYLERLNNLARNLADSINAVYNPDSGAVDFFRFEDSGGNPVTGSDRTAGQIFVSQLLIDSPQSLDGKEALDVARLRNNTSVFSGTKTDVNGQGWDLTITADNEDLDLDGFTFSFGADNDLPLSVAYSTPPDKITIQADWDDNNSLAPTWEQIQAEINNVLTANGFSTVTISDGGNFSAGDIGASAFDIQLANVLDLDNNTLESYYQSFVAEVGATTESAQNMQNNQQAILYQITNLRQSTSGVSLDEELSRMIEFQYAYQASARMMSTLDNLLDTLINRTAI